MVRRLSYFRKFIVAQAKLYGRGREWELYDFLLDRLIQTVGDLPLDTITPDVLKRFEAAIAVPGQPLVTHYRMRVMREILEWVERIK